MNGESGTISTKVYNGQILLAIYTDPRSHVNASGVITDSRYDQLASRVGEIIG